MSMVVNFLGAMLSSREAGEHVERGEQSHAPPPPWNTELIRIAFGGGVRAWHPALSIEITFGEYRALFNRKADAVRSPKTIYHVSFRIAAGLQSVDQLLQREMHCTCWLACRPRCDVLLNRRDLSRLLL